MTLDQEICINHMYPMYHWSIELKIKTKRTTKIKCYELHYDNEQ